jgi:UDP:flavonoid glycosyltransferase YjiC (YdhE family)
MEGGDSSRRLYVVMLPFLGQSHFNVCLQLSRMLATRGVAVIYVSLPSNLEIVRPLVEGQRWNDPGFPLYFQDLSIPDAEAPLPLGRQNTNKISLDMIPKIFDLLEQMRDPLEVLMRELIGREYYESRGLPAPDRLVLVFDFFMGWSAAVAAKFGVWSFTFHPFSAHMWLCKEAIFLGRAEPLLLPEVAEAVKKLPSMDFVATHVRRHMDFTRLADGLLLNTFEEVEPKVIRYLESVGVGGGKPFWAVGPVIDLPRGDQTRGPRDDEILAWLDRQTPGSVVYVSFGTESYISPAQVTELALGLETSGQPFLWALRPPESLSAEDWKSDLLPEGYERRMQGRCLIETGWAPQGAILAHEATGAFISHCGWNSCLESVAAGVPLIALPLQTDQPANALLLAKETKVAVEMKFIDGVARREEVESAVRSLMAGEEEVEVKRRVKAVSKAAVSALSYEGGAAWKNLESFIQYSLQE